MTGTPLLKRMLDAGMQFTGTSQEQAERLVKEFVKAGQARRKDTEELVRQVVERGRTATEHVVAAVHAEVNKQMAKFAGRIDDVEARVEEIAKRLGLPSSAAKLSKQPPPKKAPAQKTAAKKTAAKKTAAKKTAAKKARGEKTPAKTAPTESATTENPAAAQ